MKTRMPYNVNLYTCGAKFTVFGLFWTLCNHQIICVMLAVEVHLLHYLCSVGSNMYGWCMCVTATWGLEVHTDIRER